MEGLTTTDLAFVAYLAPLALIFSAIIARIEHFNTPQIVFQIGRAVIIGAVLMSVLLGAVVFIDGPMVSPVIGTDEVGLSLRLDAVSIVMFWLVAFLGAFLVQFSRNYLDGDPRHTVFLSRLYLTIGSVLFFVLAGNLWQLVLGWMAMSFALHLLLVFYSERPRAIMAARKKFIVARLGDLFLIIAALLIVQAFGTTDLAALATAAAEVLEMGTAPTASIIAGVFVVIAAALKSAMFPFHGWLLEVMETPTPVSALLHAGILNAGTFLIVRLGDLVFLSTPALILLIVVGGFTAMFASSAMITQNSVKVSLAYSSAAHMGFMLMLCGFGAHSVAIMHLVAHSFYKAHAFLSSGSIVEYVQHTGAQKLNKAPNPLTLFVNLMLSLVIFLSIATLIGIDVTKRPGETALGAIFVMAVAHLLVKGMSAQAPRMVMARTAFLATAVTLAFFGLELMAAAVLGDAVAVFPEPDTATTITMILAVFAFGTVTMLGSLLPAFERTPAWRAFYVHLKNGFYANAMFDRLMSSASR